MNEEGWLIGKACLWKRRYPSIAYSCKPSTEERTSYSIFCYNSEDHTNQGISTYDNVPEEELIPLHPNSEQAKTVISNILWGLYGKLEYLRRQNRCLEQITQNKDDDIPF